MSTAPTAAAYGVRLVGLPETPRLRLTGVDEWPAVQVEWGELDQAERPLVMDVARRRAVVAADVGAEEVAHPLMTMIGLHMAVAHGHDALHAGALAGGDGAWAVAGPKTAGKSTLLAACARRGIPVVADDALMLDGRRCFAGPRCIDLRLPAAERLGADLPVRMATPRRRLGLPPIGGEHELAGVVHLAWGPRPELRRLSAADSLARLLERHWDDGFPRDPVGVMDLSCLPAYELARPRDWGCLEETVGLVEGLLGLGVVGVPGERTQLEHRLVLS